MRHIVAGIAFATAAVLVALSAEPAAAQFSPREGFTAAGAPQWSFEVSPYLFLPAISAHIGLNHPPGFDISIDRPSPTVSDLKETLTGAFVADTLARKGNWSGELNIFYVAGQVTKAFPPVLPHGMGATLKTTASEVFVSPGFGYQVLPTDASSKMALDVRVGFSYNSVSAGAEFQQSKFGGVNVTSTFAQPWIGARLAYYPSPRWRVVVAPAITGLGVDGGTIGWNGRAGVSYLIAKWVDVTLGYAAFETRRSESLGTNGENRSLTFLAHGPFLAFGFRF